MIFLRDPGDLVGHREEIEELPNLHAIVDAEVVGHETDHAADGHRVGRHRVAADPSLARGRAQQRGQEPDRRALARAVGTDEPEDLSLANGEAEVVDGHEIAVPLGEIDHLDHARTLFPRDRRQMKPNGPRKLEKPFHFRHQQPTETRGPNSTPHGPPWHSPPSSVCAGGLDPPRRAAFRTCPRQCFGSDRFRLTRGPDIVARSFR